MVHGIRSSEKKKVDMPYSLLISNCDLVHITKIPPVDHLS